MSELKTLKDFKEKSKLGIRDFVFVDELKVEAVKWVKRLRQQDVKENDNQNQISIANFIDFFNLTKEDLK